MGKQSITTPDRSQVIFNQDKDLNLTTILQKVKKIADYAADRASELDRQGTFPTEEFKQIAAAGLLAAPLSPSLGGLGLGFKTGKTKELLMLLKEIGRGNLAVGRVYEGHVNALQLIQTFGTPEQIETFAADARDRNKIFGVWNAEASDGVKIIPLDEDAISEVSSEIKAVRNGKYFLQGSKTFASGCGYVERPFVNGVLPDGSWQMCIVPMDEVETVVDRDWWQPSGMKATISYKVDFTGIELDRSCLIGNPGDYLRQPWLSAGVIRFAAVQLGGAEALFNATRQYLQELNRTSHLNQQERLGRMAIAIESGNLWLYNAAEKIDRYAPIFGGYPDLGDRERANNPLERANNPLERANNPLERANNPLERANNHSPLLVSYANMVRTAIEQICMDVIQLSQRSIGTLGLLPPHPMERIIRDLSLYLRQPAYDVAIAKIGEYVLSEKVAASDIWLI
jgi:alkylation response protein AidB-like acyl-CoA dehydrogenase